MGCFVGKEHLESYNKIKSMQEQLSKIQSDYWYDFSGFDTWQFWVILIFFFLAPLISLFFLLDQKERFSVGFFGFNIHVWFGYIDRIGSENGYWGYPYKLVPFIPGNISVDAALVPISYIFVYQWTKKKKKNFYIYATGLSLFFSFIFKPIIHSHQLFELHKGTNYFHLFLLYCLIFIFSKIVTNIYDKLPLRGMKQSSN